MPSCLRLAVVLLAGVAAWALAGRGAPALAAQSDLDAFMAQVFAHRDENWKKLRQYVLDERERIDVTGPGAVPIWGDQRTYTWYIRSGLFVRSPVTANGVTIPETERRKYEDEFLERARKRESKEERAASEVGPPTEAGDLGGLLAQSRQPGFIDSAYFLRFKFEAGTYAFVGRETIDGVDVLRIEYYPARLFSHEQDDQDRRRAERRAKQPDAVEAKDDGDRKEDVEAKMEALMNKVSLVTLWVTPDTRQIVRYTFDNVHFDFLPAAWLLRVNDITATMNMSQPFKMGQSYGDVWLPRDIDMRLSTMLAIGSIDVRYRLSYTTPGRDRRTRCDTRHVLRAMTMLLGLWLALGAVTPLTAAQGVAAPAREVIADIRVHGNQISSDDAIVEIVRLAGVARGDVFDATTIARVRTALDRTGKFRRVEVLERFTSIADPSQILIVIVVDEGPVSVESAATPGAPARVVRRRAVTNVMFMPILEGEDGYGLTYGARVAYVGVTGKRGRLSAPLAWGGKKQAGLEFDRDFVSGPVTRLQLGAALGRSTNPAFDEDDTRRRLWIRAERAVGFVRAGGEAGWQRVDFAGAVDRFRYVSADVTFDTRVDPVLPRNAVYVSAGWTHFRFGDESGVDRGRLDGRGYVGLIGQNVLVGRVLREDASAPLPPYLDSLLGGWSNLRGFRAGSFAGDRLLQTSLELRVPVSSPLHAAKLGFSVFADTGKVYDRDQRASDVPFHTGMGCGVWMALTALRAGLSVAHGLDAGTRVNFGLGLTY